MTLRTRDDDPIRFFLAGPTYVLQEVLRAQVRQPVAHRSPAFRETQDRIAGRLSEVFRTPRPVVVATASATLLMEAAVASTVERRVLNLVGGAFSERWHLISRLLGKEADTVAVPWGRGIDPELVRAALRRGRYEAITVVHNETSTGVLNPLEEIARVVRAESDGLLLVDAVSSLAGAPVETAAWGLDVVVTASQKGLALPPGLAFAAVSERAEERARAVARRGFYTDLVRYLDQHRAGGPITTPAVTLYWALDRQLDQVLGEGLEGRWQRHRALREQTLEWAAAAGIEPAADQAVRSPTVTCLRAPAGLDGPGVVARLAERGFTVAGGYGQWKTATFRIGHMGEVNAADLAGLLTAASAALGAVATPGGA